MARASMPLRNSISFSFRPSGLPSPNLWEGGYSKERWIQFNDQVRDEYCKRYAYCVLSDIEDFFNSILHSTLADAIHTHIRPLFTNPEDYLTPNVERLFCLLNGWFPIPGIRIPQGPSASFFFAELVLLNVDLFCSTKDFVVARFVDDYRIFGNTEAFVIHQHDLIEAKIAELCLQFNANKYELILATVLAERLDRLKLLVEQFKRTTSGWPPASILQYAIQKLKEEFAGTRCKHSISFLLSVIKRGIRGCARISDSVLNDLYTCFQTHSSISADALQIWLVILKPLINYPTFQEFLGEILFSGENLLDTDIAGIYGCFHLTTAIKSTTLADKLLPVFENDTVVEPDEYSGSTIARKGKALRAAIKHNNGDQILMDMFRKNNNYAEMRRYTAVAPVDMSSTKHKHEFWKIQRASCDCFEERIAIDYFENNGEDITPDGLIKVVHQGY
jgi:hypothetical protein